MKGNKLVIAVILALIVCLVLIPTCAFADGEGEPSDNLVAGTSTTGGDDPSGTPDGGNDSGAGSGSDSGNGGSDASDSGASGESGNVNPGNNDSDKNLPESGDEEEGNTTSGGNGDGAEAPKPGDKEQPEEKDPEASGEENEDAKPEEGSDSGAESGGEEDTPASGEDNAPLQPAEPTKSESSSSFKVILSYGDKSVELNDLKGGEQNDLAALISQLGIDGDIESAQGNADDLFSAASTEDGWKLITSRAFGTKQTLTLVVDGVEYVIDVADDQDVSSASGFVEAVSNCDGGTIKLTDNISLSGSDIAKVFGESSLIIAKNKTVTIDLNGYTLSCKIHNGNITRLFDNYGNLTIKDSSSNLAGKILVEQGHIAITNRAGANLTLERGTIENSVGSDVLEVLGGKVVINDGVKLINTRSYDKNVIRSECEDSSSPATVQINGGEFDGIISNGKNCEITISNGHFLNSVSGKGSGSKLAVNGGIFESGVLSSEDSNLIINKGTFNGTVKSFNKGNVTIKDGTFNKDVSATGFVANDANLTIDGGTFNSDVLAGDENSILPPPLRKSSGNITVNNGTFNGSISARGNGIFNARGGIYSDENVKNLVGEGYEVKNVDGGKYAVSKVPETKPEAKPGAESKGAASAAYAAPLYAKYFVIEGKEQQWTAGDIEFVLNSNAVIKVLIDGVEVEFTVAEDGTVTIAEEIIEALSDGEHEIKFIFADGSCKTTFTR